MIWAVIGLVAVEGAVLDILLARLLPGSIWIWVSLGIHLYALLWLLGCLASFLTRPHQFEADALRLRDGVFSEMVIPYAAITGARIAVTPNFGRSGLKIDELRQAAMLAFGDGTVDLVLDPTQALQIGGRSQPSRLAGMAITVDKPQEFVTALRERLVGTPASCSTGASHRR